MKITENAMKQFASLIEPNSGLAEGIRISQGNGCCGPAFKMSKVKQPYSTDIIENHEGINLYLDVVFEQFREIMTIDYLNEYFQIQGVANTQKSGCC